MTLRLSLIFLFVVAHIYAQIDLKISYKSVDDGINIYTENNEYCPVSLHITFELDNMQPVQPIGDLYVIEPKSAEQLLIRLERIDPAKSYEFKYFTQYQWGNHLMESYDKDYAYSLPFEKGNTHRIYQGYNGKVSHQKKYALDFDLAEGTPVAAMRDGVVIEVVDHNNQSCAEEYCKKFNNKIIVYHKDGTFAEYVHLEKNGALVKVGDQVLQDQIIGKSGNTGWSSGPHLHVSVYQQRMTYRASLSTKFKIDDGTQTALLKEGASYSKNY